MELINAKSEGMKKGLFISIAKGVFYFVIFATFALAFW